MYNTYKKLYNNAQERNLAEKKNGKKSKESATWQ